MKLLLIDNYDSFTYNVYQYLSELRHFVIVKRNDKVTIREIYEMDPDAIFLSPGPGTPDDAGISLEVVREFAGKKSIFGICLGHQTIGQAFGGKIIHANSLFHGKTSMITPLNKGVMKDFHEPFIATRYHSLVVERKSLPECFDITAEIEDGTIMGLIHKEFNIEGVQFHPESILTGNGKQILNSFLERTKKLLNITVDKTDVSLLRFSEFEKIDFRDSQKITVNQTTGKVPFNDDSFEIFKKIQKKYGGANSFLLESAAGPEIDCQQTFIGLFPVLEIQLLRGILKIDSPYPRIKQLLEKAFESIYKKTDEGFDIRDDRFSDIFSVFRNLIELKKDHDEQLPISNMLVGYFGYEYLHYIEKIPRIEENILELPEVHLKYFQSLLIFPNEGSMVQFIENEFQGIKNDMPGLVKLLAEGKKPGVRIREKGGKTTEEIAGKSNITKEFFFKNAVKALKHIYDGDIFQVQIGQRVLVEKQVNPLVLYERLREINPSPYMFYWDCENYQLISNSPELQLRVDNNAAIIRPIAGTSKGKGNTPAEREKIIREFSSDEKERAEHVMLVDLARNDVGHVAIPGTVKVDHLLAVEEYSHVFHITSTVKGNIIPNLNTMKLFEATFPAGTLTGAPKVRAMEIISNLETEIRGPYGGAFGIFDLNGNIISSIIIRTILRKGDKLYLQASAGFVADSVPENEWNETLHKMRALKVALQDM